MVKQYDVYWVDLNPTVGSEIQKKRPCVVVSPKVLNENLKTVIIAPLTSTLKKWPTRIGVTVNNKKGEVALDQIRCVDQVRLLKKIASLDASAIDAIKEVLVEMFK